MARESKKLCIIVLFLNNEDSCAARWLTDAEIMKLITVGMYVSSIQPFRGNVPNIINSESVGKLVNSILESNDA